MREQKKSAGFTLIEILVGVAVIVVALGMVGAARQKRETVKRQVQTNIEQAAQTRSKIEEETREIPKKEPETDVKEEPQKRERPTTSKQDKDIPRIEAGDVNERDQKETKGKRPQASSGDKGSSSFDVGSCFPGSPDPSCIAIFGEEPSSSWYEQQQQPGTAAYYQQQEEAQQQLYEQYYYYEQQQQEMFDPNQFMQGPYQQYNPVLQDFYQQMLPGVYPQFFPGQ